MTIEHGRVGRGLWLQWLLASAVGGAIGVVVFGSMSVAVSQGVGGVVGETVFGAVALGGIVGFIGIAQWLVLRRQVVWAGLWVLADAVGGAMGGAVGLGVFGVLSVSGRGDLGGVVGGVVGLAAFGITQWLVLRRQVPRAGWWVLASAVGLVVAGPTSGGAPGPFGVGGGVFGAVYGAITGIALVGLLQQHVPQGED